MAPSKKDMIQQHFAGNWRPLVQACGCDLSGCDGRDQIQVSAPYREDRSPSLCMNLTSGLWDDKARDGFQGDGFKLWAVCHNLDCHTEFPRVLDGIINHFGIVDNQQPKNEKRQRKHVRTLAERGITEATAQLFGLVEKPGNGRVDHCIDIPLQGANGEVVVTKTHKSHASPKGRKFPLYPSPKIVEQHSDLFVLNGELSVVRAWQEGCRNVIAGTLGEETIKEGWLPQLKGKTLRFIFDNDEAGREGVAKWCSELQGFSEAMFVCVWPAGWRDGGDAEDWINAGRRLEDLEFVEWGSRQVKVEDWPHPQPLPDSLPDADTFDTGMLPQAFSGWVEDVSLRMQCPSDYPAIGMMVALSAVVGRQIAIRPKQADDWTVVANLWGAVVGQPGLLKTPALQEALRPLVRLEDRARQEHAEATEEFKVTRLVTDAQNRHAKDELKIAIKKGKDLHAIARTAVQEAGDEPIRRRYIIHDPTVEKLGEILRDNPRGVLVFRDELTGFLRNLDREDRGTDKSFYLEAWNGTGRFSYDRIGRGTIDIDAACVSILGSIQPGPLSAYISRSLQGGVDDDGLLPRFQLVVWPAIPSAWKNIDRLPDAIARDTVSESFLRLEKIDPATVGAQLSDDGSLPHLRFSPTAQTIFNYWRAELESRLRTDDLPPVMECHLAKFRSLIPSLALLIFLADGKTGGVDEDSLVRALAWADYLESHARRIYAPALASDVTAATLIGDRIKKGSLGPEFGAREIQRKGWSGLLDIKVIAAALELLVELDWLQEKRTSTTGRTKTSYVVNPTLRTNGEKA